MDLLNQSVTQADSAAGKGGDSAQFVFGPVPVGNIGTVGVIEREMGENKYLYARFVGSGRPANIPLAACAAIVDALRADDTPETEDAPAPEVEDEDTDTPEE